MAEKQTERITQCYIIKMLNIREYNTTGNKQLFKKYIPDGWLQNDNNLLIIENKPNDKQFSEGVEQLIKYCKIASDRNENINIYIVFFQLEQQKKHIKYIILNIIKKKKT